MLPILFTQVRQWWVVSFSEVRWVDILRYLRVDLERYQGSYHNFSFVFLSAFFSILDRDTSWRWTLSTNLMNFPIPLKLIFPTEWIPYYLVWSRGCYWDICGWCWYFFYFYWGLVLPIVIDLFTCLIWCRSVRSAILRLFCNLLYLSLFLLWMVLNYDLLSFRGSLVVAGYFSRNWRLFFRFLFGGFRICRRGWISFL